MREIFIAIFLIIFLNGMALSLILGVKDGYSEQCGSGYQSKGPFVLLEPGLLIGRRVGKFMTDLVGDKDKADSNSCIRSYPDSFFRVDEGSLLGPSIVPDPKVDLNQTADFTQGVKPAAGEPAKPNQKSSMEFGFVPCSGSDDDPCVDSE